jgi:hypothetical protein
MAVQILKTILFGSADFSSSAREPFPNEEHHNTDAQPPYCSQDYQAISAELMIPK